MEVKEMESMDNQNKPINTEQEQIMNRVNQTFEQMVQDVKNMIDENNQEKNDQFS
jgi:actin-like ATPase involved in cell morphogenesis